MAETNADNPWYFLSGFLNATTFDDSLWQAVNGSLSPIAASDTGVILKLLANDSVSINFIDNGQNVWTVLPIMTQLLSPNVTRGLVTCTYPLSGSYDHLARFLFYCAALFAVLGRRFTWVAEAALGIIIVYSATAAIHLFVLLGLYRFRMPYSDDTGYPTDANDATAFGDIDYFGIAPVVSLTLLLLTPMLQWSRTFRSHRAKVVIQCWAVLMFAAACAFLALIRGYTYAWNIDQVNTAAYCLSTDASCQPTVDEDGFPWFNTREQYNRCQCTDLCGLISPNAPLRQGSSMVPNLAYAILDNLLYGKKALIDRLPAAEQALFSLWIFAIIQGIFALLGSNSTQERIRNRLFRLLYCDEYSAICFLFRGKRRDRILREHFIVPAEKSTRYWRIRFHIARVVTGFIYLLRIFAWLFYPIAFICTFIFCELFASTMPVSEPSSSLGAWSSWVSAALLVLSAIIHSTYPVIRKWFANLVNHFRYDSSDRIRVQAEITIKPIAGLSDLKQHVYFCMTTFIWEQKQRRRQFLAWWADPVKYSYPSGLDPDTNSLIEPECRCLFCQREAEAAALPSHGQHQNEDKNPGIRVEEQQVPSYSTEF